MRVFTAEELARYDGKDGTPAYIAYKGIVYDVSASFLWRRGRHWVVIQAGADLTDHLAAAPHGTDVLDRIPAIGVLE
jgi:predicted heme/steroid binding protein